MLMTIKDFCKNSNVAFFQFRAERLGFRRGLHKSSLNQIHSIYRLPLWHIFHFIEM